MWKVTEWKWERYNRSQSKGEEYGRYGKKYFKRWGNVTEINGTRWRRPKWEQSESLFRRLHLSKVELVASAVEQMKGWLWVCDRFLSLTGTNWAQLSTALIPVYLFVPLSPAYIWPPWTSSCPLHSGRREGEYMQCFISMFDCYSLLIPFSFLINSIANKVSRPFCSWTFFSIFNILFWSAVNYVKSG